VLGVGSVGEDACAVCVGGVDVDVDAGMVVEEEEERGGEDVVVEVVVDEDDEDVDVDVDVGDDEASIAEGGSEESSGGNALERLPVLLFELALEPLAEGTPAVGCRGVRGVAGSNGGAPMPAEESDAPTALPLSLQAAAALPPASGRAWSLWWCRWRMSGRQWVRMRQRGRPTTRCQSTSSPS
jgi:hypothetical protein